MHPRAGYPPARRRYKSEAGAKIATETSPPPRLRPSGSRSLPQKKGGIHPLTGTTAKMNKHKSKIFQRIMLFCSIIKYRFQK